MANLKVTAGFTLLELIITLAITAILTMKAIPGFIDLIEHQRSWAIVNKVKSHVSAARQYALSKQTPITICKSSDQQQCGGDWKDGFLIFEDPNWNGQIDEDELIFRTVNGLFDEGSLKWRSFGNKAYLQFHPSGRTNYQNGSFTYCSENDIQKAMGFSVTVTGRLQMAIDRNGDGVAENSNGKALKC